MSRKVKVTILAILFLVVILSGCATDPLLSDGGAEFDVNINKNKGYDFTTGSSTSEHEANAEMTLGMIPGEQEAQRIENEFSQEVFEDDGVVAAAQDSEISGSEAEADAVEEEVHHKAVMNDIEEDIGLDKAENSNTMSKVWIGATIALVFLAAYMIFVYGTANVVTQFISRLTMPVDLKLQDGRSSVIVPSPVAQFSALFRREPQPKTYVHDLVFGLSPIDKVPNPELVMSSHNSGAFREDAKVQMTKLLAKSVKSESATSRLVLEAGGVLNSTFVEEDDDEK